MKKLFAFLLAIPLLFFAGCAAKTPPEADVPTDTNPPEQTTPLPQPEDSNTPSDDTQPEEITEMYITINGNKLKVTLDKNSSVDALITLLKQGDITYTADDYGGFEKVGNIGHTLERNDTPIDTEAGDVILYQGNQLCLYYGKNSYTFTRIGKINGYNANELKTLLGAGKGKVQVTISLK